MELMKTPAAARYLNCSEAQLRQLAKAGKIAFFRSGTSTSVYQFLKTDLDAYVAANRVPTKEAA